MFYYIQDSSLFKIKSLAAQYEGRTGFEKLIDFSPEFLSSFLAEVEEICFTNGTAVSKVLVMSCFGPCVMAVLCILYLWKVSIQKLCRKKSK